MAVSVAARVAALVTDVDRVLRLGFNLELGGEKCVASGRRRACFKGVFGLRFCLDRVAKLINRLDFRPG